MVLFAVTTIWRFSIFKFCYLSLIYLLLFQQDFFDEYRIEGKDERNTIYLEIVADNLVRAMRSAQNSQALKLKLTRKQTSCLTFEVSLV